MFKRISQPRLGKLSTYQPLGESVEEEEYDKKTSQESNRFLLWGLALGALVLAIVIYSLVSVGTTTIQPYAYDRYDPRTNRCGSTVEEAKRFGCQFDPTTLAWLPVDCLDDDLVREFKALEPILYADRNKSTTRTWDEWSISRGQQPVWLTHKDRNLLCIYAWKRMHRAILAGRNIPTGIGSYKETEECAQYLREEVPLDRVVKSVSIEFPSC